MGTIGLHRDGGTEQGRPTTPPNDGSQDTPNPHQQFTGAHESELTRTVSPARQPLLSSSELGVLFMLKRAIFLGLLLVASELATGCCCCGGWRPFWRRCCEPCSSSCYTPSSGSNCSGCGGSAAPVMGDFSQPPAGPTMPQSVPLTRR